MTAFGRRAPCRVSTSVGGMNEPLVEVRDLRKSYGEHAVLRGVSFDVRAGEILGLAGRNGAGKTTTVEIAQGLRRGDSGTVRVLGLDPARDRARIRKLVGSQLQSSALPARLRVGEALRLFARLADDVTDWRVLARQWGVEHLLHAAFADLSGGERQRLFLALAMVTRPRIIFLDELTQGLDAMARRHTWDLVRRVRDEGASVVLVSHDMAEIEALCDRVALLVEGRIAEQGSPQELVARLGGPVIIRFRPDGAIPHLTHLQGVVEVSLDSTGLGVLVEPAAVVDVVAELAQQGFRPTDLRIDRTGFEEVFMRLTNRPRDARGASDTATPSAVR